VSEERERRERGEKERIRGSKRSLWHQEKDEEFKRA